MEGSSARSTISDPWSLHGRGCRPESLRTILEEDLLPHGLLERLHALYPEASGLRLTAAPMFVGKDHFAGLGGFREVCAILEANGIDIGFQEERELFIDVYRFLATRHTLNSIDWSRFQTDSMFQLVFPQPGMIRREVVTAYEHAATRDEKMRIAADYMHETNPHDCHQQLNKPLFTNEAGEATLAEQGRSAETGRRATAEAHPLVQAILAAFPGATIEAVRDAAADNYGLPLTPAAATAEPDDDMDGRDFAPPEAEPAWTDDDDLNDDA